VFVDLDSEIPPPKYRQVGEILHRSRGVEVYFMLLCWPSAWKYDICELRCRSDQATLAGLKAGLHNDIHGAIVGRGSNTIGQALRDVFTIRVGVGNLDANHDTLLGLG
jgi:hypothetical protein